LFIDDYASQGRSKKKKVRGAKLKKYFKKSKILIILQRERLGKISLQEPGPLPASPWLRH
jgi:hypothetical protein